MTPMDINRENELDAPDFCSRAGSSGYERSTTTSGTSSSHDYLTLNSGSTSSELTGRKWKFPKTSKFNGTRSLKKSKRTGLSLKKISPAERDLRLLSSKAAEAYQQTKFDTWLARKNLVVPYLITIMAMCYIIPTIILVLSETDRNFAEYGRWIWRATIFMTFGLTLPMWIAMMQWRPALPLNGDIEPGEHMPTVDIAIASYKEDITEIVDTIVACQRVEYPDGLLHVYLLDDGRRKELDDACEDLHRSGLLRHPLTYVDRPSNEGKKAGNINHWLDKYEFESGEFFIILDADMQPFPDMLDILMGHFLGMSKSERERCAYVQAPQWYRNYNGKKKWADIFNISEFFFYRVLQPANSTWGCTVYVGCCALWRRQAIESVNGFIGGYATEDSVTGCQVNRTLVPGKDVTWISKFVMQPIAAGLSPETLPSLLEQRLRWYKGLCEMFAHHNGYLFATGLSPMQRVLYWTTSASYFSNILQYITVFIGTLLLMASITAYSQLDALGDLALWAFWGGPAAFVATLLIWSLIPGCSFVQYFHTMATAFLYTPVYIAACLKHYFNITITIQTTAAEAQGGIRRWSNFFIIPVVCLSLVVSASGVALWSIATSAGDKPVTMLLQIPIWISFWCYIHYHVLLSLMGYSYSEIDFYQREAIGAFSDERVKAYLSRHVAQLDTSYMGGEDNFSSDESHDGTTRSTTGSDGEHVNLFPYENALGMTQADKERVIANLNFFQARRRAVTETIIAETFELGDNQSFSGQKGLKYEQDGSQEYASVSSYSTLAGAAGHIGESVAFERKLLAFVQAEASDAAHTRSRGAASAHGGRGTGTSTTSGDVLGGFGGVGYGS